MPLYDFLNEATGETAEFHFPMSMVPSIGQVVQLNNQPHRRLPSDHQFNDARPSQRFPVKSRVLPDRMEGFKHHADGSTIVRNKKDVAELKAMGYEQR
jgi:hypothetical protein